MGKKEREVSVNKDNFRVINCYLNGYNIDTKSL